MWHREPQCSDTIWGDIGPESQELEVVWERVRQRRQNGNWPGQVRQGESGNHAFQESRQVQHSSSIGLIGPEASLDYVKTCPKKHNFKSSFLVNHINKKMALALR